MPYGVHVVVFGMLGLGFGLAELAAPALVLEAYGLEPGTGALVVTRLAAALNVGFGLAAVLSRRTEDASARRAILGAGLAYALIATAVAVQSALAGTSGAAMWSLLLITVPMGGNAARLLVATRHPWGAPHA